MQRNRSLLPLFACALALAACGKTEGSSEQRGGFTQAGTGAVGGASATSGTGGSGALGGVSGIAAGVGGNVSPQAGSSAAGSGTSGIGGAPAGAGGADLPGTTLDKGNFFQSGAWQGYVWTSTSGAGSTITPMTFEAQATGMPRCVQGSVSAQADYSGTAILGFNLSEGPGVTSMTITPTTAGVIVDVANPEGSPLRFQIKSAITGGTEWCAPIMGSGGFIAWESLRTECWGSGGAIYQREPIAAAMVLVPGTNEAAVAFDFCVNALVEADGPATGGSGGAGGVGGAAGGGAGGSGGGASGSGGGETVPPLTDGCDGFATRYWDCCKPHCGWSGNSPSGALASCDASDNSLGGNFDAANACAGGSAFLCHHNTPWAVSDNLAYGFAAVSAAASSDICGKCYQLDFTGSSHNAAGDPGSALLAGKHMIVQAINVGGDVGSGQFDLAIPGGGVGAFNACSAQWGVSTSQLGPDFGGFLAACKQTVSATDGTALKNCVTQKCSEIFAGRGLSELEAGCRWFVEWFHAADNPSLRYAEVPCPSALSDRGIRRSSGGGGCL